MGGIGGKFVNVIQQSVHQGPEASMVVCAVFRCMAVSVGTVVDIVRKVAMNEGKFVAGIFGDPFVEV